MFHFAKNLTTVRAPGHNALSMSRIQVLETTCEAISYQMHLKGISKAFCSQCESCCGFGDKIYSCPRPSASKKEITTDLIFYLNFVIFKNENTPQNHGPSQHYFSNVSVAILPNFHQIIYQNVVPSTFQFHNANRGKKRAYTVNHLSHNRVNLPPAPLIGSIRRYNHIPYKAVTLILH